MALTVYEDLEQGSEAWLQARCGIDTASVVKDLVTAKTLQPAKNDTARGITAQLVAERITGYVEPTYANADMERGNVTEPFARDMYAAEQGLTVDQVGFMVRDFNGDRLGYSPDGLVGEVGLIEIKAPRQKGHLATILADEVPAQYMPQLQCGLLVSGRGWIDYVSYCGGFPLFVKRVRPDEKWQQAIIDSLALFEANAEAMTSIYNNAAKGKPLAERIDIYGEMEIVIK